MHLLSPGFNFEFETLLQYSGVNNVVDHKAALSVLFQTYKIKHEVKTLSCKHCLIFTLLETNWGIALKQPFNFPFLSHKSATASQIYSNAISNSKPMLDLCNCVNSEAISTTASPMQPHKWEATLRLPVCAWTSNKVFSSIFPV